jgi:membrane-bound ClpP family serine protease
VVIDNKRYDVVTQGSYIEKDKMVEVIDVVGVRIVVEERQE